MRPSLVLRTSAHGSILIALALAAWACGGSSNATSGGTTTGGGGAAGQGGQAGDGGFATGGSGGGSLSCSPDLHAVVDGTGAVVSTCPDDQGCLDGKCVEACAAAAGSHGNVGCEFRTTTTGSFPPALPPCFAAFVANTWPRPAKLTVSRGGQTLDVTQFGRIPVNGMAEKDWPAVPATGVPVGEVAVLFLSHDPKSNLPETGKPLTCPVKPAIEASTFLAGSGKGEAFHIVSDTPVSMYDILPYGGAESHFPSAQLLFPTSAWGTNYVVIATPKGTDPNPGPLWGHVLASADGTKIDLLPSVGLPKSADFAEAPAGVKTSFTLDAGQYLQWELPAGSEDMSGTIVSSDKPVAVFAGNRFFRLQPMSAPGGESTHQEVLPVSALSSEYVVAPYDTRRKDLQPENIHYRIVAALDGTALKFDPDIPGAPATVGQKPADFQATGPFRVTSQDAGHPFSIAQIMDTCNLPGGTREGATAPDFPPNLGDEEFVVLLPPQQFLSNYVFFTDPTYATTNLVLTRVKTKGEFKDVSVDCLGTIGGWQPAGASGQYEVTSVDLVRADKGNMGCQNGRHTAKSDGPFGIVVWGLDSYSSYAYPAGGYAAPITSVVVPPEPK
jgi:hypothetical protein